jgi:hypothetical protein
LVVPDTKAIKGFGKGPRNPQELLAKGLEIDCSISIVPFELHHFLWSNNEIHI